jgi:hypothetical protein
VRVYLHEIMRTVPGREEPYMASVLSVVERPGRQRSPDHNRQLGLFRSAETSGPFPLVINIWEHSWASQAAALERQFADAQRDRGMEDWWNRNLHLRRGGYDRLLIPTAYTPDAAGLARAGVRGRVFLHEIVWLPLGAADDYLTALGQQFLPLARRFDWQLVGAYRVSQRPRQALALFALRQWSDLARLLAARAADGELRRWFDYRDGLVEEMHELVLLPGRMNPLGIRD